LNHCFSNVARDTRPLSREDGAHRTRSQKDGDKEADDAKKEQTPRLNQHTAPAAHLAAEKHAHTGLREAPCALRRILPRRWP